MAVGTILSAASRLTLARVFVWIGFAAWRLVAAGLLSRGQAFLASPRRSQEPGGS
ncbi:MAG TPA: hypothetical protein VNF24_11405 [Candidatus Acidoferrales bacterium]|nr:hypothetical protein [Candidatus Acidoferrales bacterium]